MTVEAGGRGEAARPRRAELWLPADGGGVEPAEPVERGRPAGRSRAAFPCGSGRRGGRAGRERAVVALPFLPPWGRPAWT